METKHFPRYKFMLPHITDAWGSVVPGAVQMLPASHFLYTHIYILANERRPNAKTWQTVF